MRLTETTLDIIRELGQDPFSTNSIRAIAKKLQKSYSLVHAHTKKLQEQGIIKQEGTTKNCTLDLSNPQTQHLLGYIRARGEDDELAKTVADINQEQTLITACTKEGVLWLVTNDDKKARTLKKKIPYPGVEVINTRELKELLLKSAKEHDIPRPLLHYATFYDNLSTIQVIRGDAA